MTNVKELYKDPSATKQFWDQKWAGQDYDEMLSFELGNVSQRAAVDKFVKVCRIRNGNSV